MFALVVAAALIIAWCELAMMRASSLAEFGRIQRLTQVPLFVLVAGVVVFLRLYFGTGRLWLGGAAVGVRLVALGLGYVVGPSLHYRELSALRRIVVLGQDVTIVEGIFNPWTWVAWLSSLLLVAFIVDAGIACWRRGEAGDRRRTWTVGGSLAFFTIAATAHSGLVMQGIMESPYMISLFFLAAVVAMGSELTNDVVRTAELARRLRDSEAQVALAAEAANVGAWVWDAGADRVWLSDETRRLFGYDPAARPPIEDMFARIHPDDRESVRRAVQQAMAADVDLQVEYRVNGRDGTVRWVASRGRRHSEAGRRVQQMEGVTVDITDRRRAQEEARRSREQVTHLSRVALANELSGSLAHELNQPLGAILSNAQAIRRLLDREHVDRPELREIIDDIIADDQHAADVMQRVRALVRRVEPRPESLHVSDVVREAMQMVRRELVERGITLEVELAEGLPPLLGDRTQLQQLVLNLAVNAMDAMADRSRSPRRLSVRTLRDGDGVCMAVADSGPGIAPDMLERIFEPFVTTKAHGLGMGLAVCNGIVEAHGGRLRAENNGDGGATLWVHLPAARDGG